MLTSVRSKLTYANVASSIALFVALSGGVAYAANTISSGDIVDGEVRTNDIRDAAVTNPKLAPNSVGTGKIIDGTVGAADIANGAVNSNKLLDGGVATADLGLGAVSNTKLADGAVDTQKVLDDSQVGGGLGSSDLATNAVGSAEIQTDAVAATEIANDSIDAGEIVDFGLTNQDVGVLFAEVNAAATLANSSGGVTVARVGAVNAGTYQVDFGRNITLCTAVATIGGATTTTASGQINVSDRSGNTEAVFVDTNDTAGAAADRPFRLVVVC